MLLQYRLVSKDLLEDIEVLQSPIECLVSSSDSLLKVADILFIEMIWITNDFWFSPVPFICNNETAVRYQCHQPIFSKDSNIAFTGSKRTI